jgi:hypothetical protein
MMRRTEKLSKNDLANLDFLEAQGFLAPTVPSPLRLEDGRVVVHNPFDSEEAWTSFKAKLAKDKPTPVWIDKATDRKAAYAFLMAASSFVLHVHKAGRSEALAEELSRRAPALAKKLGLRAQAE